MPTLRHTTAAFGAIATIAAAGALAVVTTGSPAAAAPAAVSYKSPAPDASSGLVLRPGDALVAGSARTDRIFAQSLPSAAGYVTSFPALELVMQGDGNLVEYETLPSTRQRRAVWATGTTTATRLTFQSDHNVVLRDGAGRAVRSTGTAGSNATYFSLYGNGQLAVQDAAGHPAALLGKALTPAPGVLVGESASPDSRYELEQQSDGNLVEYHVLNRDHRQAVWSTRTAGAGAVRLAAQSDGNLVLRQVATGKAVWASGSHGPTAYYQLDVQADSNVVLYRTDGTRRVAAVWASGIHR